MAEGQVLLCMKSSVPFVMMMIIIMKKREEEEVIEEGKEEREEVKRNGGEKPSFRRVLSATQGQEPSREVRLLSAASL